MPLEKPEVLAQLEEFVDCSEDVCGGALVFRGTRFPVSRVLAELADDRKLSEVVADYDLDQEKVVGFLEALARLAGH